jgi:hypothetical protein
MRSALKLSEEDMGETAPDGELTLVASRVLDALRHLKMAALVEITGRGAYLATDKGRQVIALKTCRLTRSSLEIFPAYNENLARLLDPGHQPQLPPKPEPPPPSDGTAVPGGGRQREAGGEAAGTPGTGRGPAAARGPGWPFPAGIDATYDPKASTVRASVIHVMGNRREATIGQVRKDVVTAYRLARGTGRRLSKGIRNKLTLP